MKISITIDRATVSTTVNSPEEFWSMTIPCMMAAGYSYDTAFRTLEDFFEGEKQAFVDMVGDDPEEYKNWSETYDTGYLDGKNGIDPVETEGPYYEGWTSGQRAHRLAAENAAEEGAIEAWGKDWYRGYSDGRNGYAPLESEGAYYAGWKDGNGMFFPNREEEELEEQNYHAGYSDGILKRGINLDMADSADYNRGYDDAREELEEEGVIGLAEETGKSRVAGDPRTEQSMTKHDIIRMALEAEFALDASGLYFSTESDLTPALERFAALVAQAERKACAKLVWQTEESRDEYVSLRETVASAIRARSDVVTQLPQEELEGECETR